MRPFCVSVLLAATMFAAAPLRAQEGAAASETSDTSVIAYRLDLSGLSDFDIRSDFEAFSLLLRDETRTAPSLAELARRLRVDATTIARLLRAKGYYDSIVEPEPIDGTGSETRRLAFAIDSGPLYRFRSVTAPGLDIEEGDAVDAREVTDAVEALRRELLASGYVFAEVGEPDIVIDHRTSEAELTLYVDPGPSARFGDIVVVNADAPFNARHVEVLSRFERGDPWNSAGVEDLRRALIATGLVGSVRVSPVRPTDPVADETEVDIAVDIPPAPPRTLAAQIGYDTEDGARIEGSWQHRNLLPPEGAFTGTLIAGEQELLAAGELRRSNWRERDQSVGARVAVFSEDREAFYNQGVSLLAYLERETNLIWQKTWTYRVGPELLFTRERDRSATSSALRDYVIAAVGGRISYDGTDDLLDPTESFRLSGSLSPELSLRGEAFGYARFELGGSGYLPLDSNGDTVIALRGEVGTIVGTDRGNIAPSRRFYAGGGGSVRGFGFQDVGPADAEGDPLGGRSKVEASIEGRFRLTERFGAAIFADAGQVYASSRPGFDNYRIGLGAGVRYYTSFGPIRADIATPLNRRPGEPLVAIYVSIGQAF